MHKSGDISLFIGSKDFRGKGFASSALRRMLIFAFNEIKLEKVNAGLYSNNQESKNLFLNCDFSVEGVLKEQVKYRGSRTDVIKMGLTCSDWRKKLKPWVLFKLDHPLAGFQVKYLGKLMKSH